MRQTAADEEPIFYGVPLQRNPQAYLRYALLPGEKMHTPHTNWLADFWNNDKSTYSYIISSEVLCVCQNLKRLYAKLVICYRKFMDGSGKHVVLVVWVCEGAFCSTRIRYRTFRTIPYLQGTGLEVGKGETHGFGKWIRRSCCAGHHRWWWFIFFFLVVGLHCKGPNAIIIIAG